MKVTIEGDLEQVSETLGFSCESPSNRKGRLAENRARREVFASRRKLVVDAFKVAREAGAEREMAALLHAIRRTGGVTEADLAIARQVLGDALSNGER